MKPITVYDIAREANVSVSTASRVLNNTAPVRASTRERIVEVIQKHQFQPNALARSLTKKSTGMIGIILPDITNPFFPGVLAGVDQAARSKGYTFFLCDTVSSGEDKASQYTRETEYLNLLAEKQVDGIIFMGGRIDLANCSQEMSNEIDDLRRRIPIVLINGDLPSKSHHRVIVNETAGAEQAAQHLINLGHRNIAFIGGYSHMTNTMNRLNGFMNVMDRNGLAVPPNTVLHGGFTVEAGKRLMMEILSRPQVPTAVICANDLTAIGAIKAAVKSGLKIPSDISIIGFDDIPFASNSIPELTTISLKCSELGQASVEMLHRLIRKEDVNELTVIEPELVVRESTSKWNG